MNQRGTRTTLCLASVAATLALAACGGADRGGGGGGGGKKGGAITIAQTSQPDFLDPALSYTVAGWEPMWLVYTPLLSYRHAEGRRGAELVPGVAESLPEVSADGRTYSLRVRRGLRYSDGAPLRASDFERTVQRVLTLESGGASFFEGIEGATEYIEAGKPGADISGIETDDRSGRVTIRLSEPDGTFSNVLATNFAGLVPGDTPFRNLTESPPPGIGPYKITRSVPNREFVLERNARFRIPGLPTGNLDRITTRIVPSLRRQTQDVIAGRLDYMQDPPPTDLLPEVRARHRDRYREFTTPSIVYLFLNERLPPFDRPAVRQAVNRAVDKRAVARLYGGRLEPSCNFLPPGVPGHRRLDPCPWGEPGAAPDLDAARRLVKGSGRAGTEVTVWGNDEPEARKVTEYYADLLNRIGLRARPRTVDGGVYYATIGNSRTRAQTGFVSFQQDFPHPLNFMSQVSGDSIQPTNNYNFGNVDDPELTEAIGRLGREPRVATVEDRWAELDRRLVERAYVVPLGHQRYSTFMSERMDFDDCSLVHPLYQNDYSSFCLK